MGDVCQERKDTLKISYCGASLIVGKQLAHDGFERWDIMNI